MDLSCHGEPRRSSASVPPPTDHGNGARVLFLGRWELRERAEPPQALQRGRELVPDLPDRVLFNRQCHSSRIVAAEEEPAFADALWTARDGVALAVFTADCVPVLLAAPDAVAAAHAGWRGLAEGIVRESARLLARRRGVPARRLVAWIGPSIAGCCYEVGEDVAARLALAGVPGSVVPRRPRPHLDLPGAALSQLLAAGVEDVRWLRRCTGCEPDRWWSHRRESGRAARNYGLVWRADGSAS
jgi:YfiH family protein